MDLTKQTIITWSVDSTKIADLEYERMNKLIQLEAENKTDLQASQIDTNKWVRHWVDQAAAQEYIDFILGLDVKYGPGLVTSTEITDIPPNA